VQLGVTTGFSSLERNWADLSWIKSVVQSDGFIVDDQTNLDST
jgi:hypothetical protein